MNRLSLHIGSEISLKDFSFSQLIIAIKTLFDTEGIPGLVKVLVILIEKMLLGSGVECPHCKCMTDSAGVDPPISNELTHLFRMS